MTNSSPPPTPTSAQAPVATPWADAYRASASRIIAAATANDAAYQKLAYLSDHIGARLSGSEELERALAWALETLKADGHENVARQDVMVPHWVRGQESAELLTPVRTPLHVLGLGMAVGTGPQGITSEVVVVDSWQALEALGEAAKGKVVLFNTPMPAHDGDNADAGYEKVVDYRVIGPSAAAKLGARAALIRSVTTHSLRSPHTGTLFYKEGAPKIPAFAVATEDADLIARLAAEGPVSVRLRSTAKLLPEARSGNVIAELRGRERPEEVVVLAAHIDSWDVGQGAHDDGAGVVIMMQALSVLRALGLEPRRTIRVVLYTNEENGSRGAAGYVAAHEDELASHVMAIESDGGGFAWQGFLVQDHPQAEVELRDLVTLLGELGPAKVKAGYSGADIQLLAKRGIPTLGLWVDTSTYFDIHHTHADTLDKVDPQDLARNVAAVAVLAFAVADRPDRLGGEPAARK